jgi:hypothetical protein
MSSTSFIPPLRTVLSSTLFQFLYLFHIFISFPPFSNIPFICQSYRHFCPRILSEAGDSLGASLCPRAAENCLDFSRILLIVPALQQNQRSPWSDKNLILLISRLLLLLLLLLLSYYC